jgi:serine protease Do
MHNHFVQQPQDWYQKSARRFSSSLGAVMAITLAAFVAPVSIAQTPVASKLAEVKIAPTLEKQISDAVVRIETTAVSAAPSAQTLGQQRMGSGVVISTTEVLTIGYLILEAESVQVVTSKGKRIPAVVAGYDHATGFGLIRTFIPMTVEPMKFGDSDSVKREQKLLNLGQGELEVTELQVISRKPFAGSWEYLLEQPIMTGPPVNNWSGSALTTLTGELVGIGSLVLPDAGDTRGEPGNLFVPVNLLKPILADLRDKGYRNGPVQAWFGLTSEMIGERLVIVRVAPDSPAAGAGLKRGDVITQVGGKPIKSQADFYRYAWAAGPAGSAVTLQVLTGDKPMDYTLIGVDRNTVLKRAQGT